MLSSNLHFFLLAELHIKVKLHFLLPQLRDNVLDFVKIRSTDSRVLVGNILIEYAHLDQARMKDPEFFFGEQRTFIHQTAPFGEILSCKFLVVKIWRAIISPESGAVR